MREIKFRATYKGVIVAYIRINPDTDGDMHTSWNITNSGGWILSKPPKHDKLDAYTGLKDKNGKEIYEGDLLALIAPMWDAKPEWQSRNGTYPVMWNGHEGAWGIKGNDGYWECPPSWWQSIEVVGNIYENPDLLTD